MVKALFDTNILIDHLQGFADASAELTRYEDVAISIITRIELLAGSPPETMAAVRALLNDFTTVALDFEIADAAAEIRRNHRIRLPDAVIWASARNQGRLLVTRNTKDFPVDDPGVRRPYVL